MKYLTKTRKPKMQNGNYFNTEEYLFQVFTYSDLGNTDFLKKGNLKK